MSTRLDLRLIPLVLSLGLDTFALSTTLGIAPLSRRARLRLAFTVTAAEGLMPAVGLLLSRSLGAAVGRWDVYAAAALLLVTGLWMLREGLAEDDERSSGEERAQILRLAAAQGLPLVGLALSVSLDELAVGFSFGILRIALVPALVAIACRRCCSACADCGWAAEWDAHSGSTPRYSPAPCSACSASRWPSGA
jgi:putative Mn2+ efflux pump MntP